MSSSSAIVCCEVFDENSQPSAEEISDYAQTIGIDPESESHLLPLAKEGLMQPLPPPWKAYFDTKLQTHYYYNEETKKTQWDHPLDNVYRDLVKKARDSSVLDDTCASVQELLTSEDNTKQIERAETIAKSDDEFSTESESQSKAKDNSNRLLTNRKTLNTRPSTAKMIDRKFADLKMSSLRRSVDGSFMFQLEGAKETKSLDRPKLFKQQSEIIDLKMHVINSPVEDTYNSLPPSGKTVHGLTLTGKGSMFLKKNDLPSPDTEKSLPLDSVKSDPLKGILRDKISDSLHKKVPNLSFSKPHPAVSFDDDKKSVRFKLENSNEPILSPGSNSSSNEGQSSIISATPSVPQTSSPHSLSPIPSPTVPSSPLNPLKLTKSPFFMSTAQSTMSLMTSSTVLAPSALSMANSMTKIAPIASVGAQKLSSISTLSNVPRTVAPTFSPIVSKLTPLAPISSTVLAPLASRPPLPPRPLNSEGSTVISPRDISKSGSYSDRESVENENANSKSNASPKRRLIRPPAADYIKSDLFQKNFQKISDLVKVADNDNTHVNLEEPNSLEKEVRPRSPRIPQQKNKLSINLMESIESETSIDSPDREFATLDLNDMDDNDDNELSEEKEQKSSHQSHTEDDLASKTVTQPRQDDFIVIKSPQTKDNIQRFDFKSDSDDARNSRDQSNLTSRSSIDNVASSQKLSPVKNPELILSPKEKSPRAEFGHNWTMSSYKPVLSKAVVTPQVKSDSSVSLNKSLSSPRIDGVVIQGGKLNKDSDVMIMYQFEPPKDKSPNSETKTNSKLQDERKKFESNLEKELEDMRLECSKIENKRKYELEEELRVNEDRFRQDKQKELNQQAERHKQETEKALQENEDLFEKSVIAIRQTIEERLRKETENAELEFSNKMAALHDELSKKLEDEKTHLQIENERALTEIAEQLKADLNREKSMLIEENKTAIQSLKQEHTAKLNELKQDYRVEIERLRSQHLCHLEELRAKLASERATGVKRDDLPDKYRCLKEKYARLKRDVKMSIERRNKRREMSMTTGSETEKSNSHKAGQAANGERCKEANETSTSAMTEQEQPKTKLYNNPKIKFNDNETSLSDSNAQKTSENNNFNVLSPETSVASAERPPTRVPRKSNTVAFKEPPRRRKERERDRGDQGTTTDYQDSSDATTADEKNKETTNGHGRRRCFTRLKSASTSRLNYSPNRRDEGWSSPLESLRQQLRKLDDLEEQFPDLACQPAYSMRYPFNELGGAERWVSPEVEFVRHRAVVEREGMRRARAVLRQRQEALNTHPTMHDPHEEREATELEVALHRARALLGEKEIRLRHIERSLRKLADTRPNPPTMPQEELTSDVSSASDVDVVESGSDVAATGAVLRSLRALHADVRDIWRALDARRTNTASPETNSYNPPSTSQQRMSLSMQDSVKQDRSEGSIAERARGLRAWLQTAP